jgi:hypothetical protein
MGKMYRVKTTVELPDALLQRAKRYARKTGRPLRALIDEGLRRVLDEPARASAYRLPDRSVGEPGARNPLASYGWSELRDEIYGGR